MTRALVLGGSGMLGHKLCQVLSKRLETSATFHGDAPRMPMIFSDVTQIPAVDATDITSVERAVKEATPDVIVNAIGIVKQLPAGSDPVQTISVNALFPHRLAEISERAAARLIHVSTDCVFSGRKGNYGEHDEPDPLDLYGRTKLLGEPSGDRVLTLRTSLIGRELGRSTGLVEWFLGHAGTSVSGFRRAIFSGVTTQTLANIIADVVSAGIPARGLWHVSSPPVDKFTLLTWLDEAFDTKTAIVPDDRVAYDRSLDSSRFWRTTGLSAPEWPQMIKALKEDGTPYGGRTHQPGPGA